MLKLTLSEFIQGQYVDDYWDRISDCARNGGDTDAVPDHDYGVYVVKNGEPLYVGMSQAGIWNRWFSTVHSHLIVDRNGAILMGVSRIGRKIYENLPASLDWTIELWNEDDCQELFADDIARLGWRADRVKVKDFEHMMIRHLQPTLNVLS